MPPVINRSYARGIRRWSGKQEESKVFGFAFDALMNGGGSLLSYVTRSKCLLDEIRRPPRPSLVAGFDLVWADQQFHTGEIRVLRTGVDKRGELIPGHKGQLLLHLTQHAVESLHQRLRTTEPAALTAELRSIGEWLGRNTEIINQEKKGLLLSQNGVFPLIRGTPTGHNFIDESCFWTAPTWIAWHGLEDHTPAKRRLAEAARAARTNKDFFTRF